MGPFTFLWIVFFGAPHRAPWFDHQNPFHSLRRKPQGSEAHAASRRRRTD
jgi:hypothetical protein